MGFTKDKISKLEKLEKVLEMDLLKYLAILDINEKLDIPLYMIIEGGWFGRNTVQKVNVQWYEIESTLESIKVQFSYNYGAFLENANFLDIQKKVFLSKEEAEQELQRTIKAFIKNN